MQTIVMPEVMNRGEWIPEPLAVELPDWNPRTDLGLAIRRCLAFLPAEMAAELIEKVSRCVVLESSLSIKVIRMCARGCPCIVEEHGVVSRKVVTTTGVGFLVDAWQNLVEFEIMKYHGIGTSAAAEAVGDTGLTTELTTQYNPDNTRATGTLEEGASANIFKTVATNTVDAGVTIEEHGILSQAAVGGGVLWDRSLTGSKALLSGEGLQSTYELTASAGG